MEHWGSNGIHLSSWLSLWIGDNSQNSGLELRKIGRTEWNLESKGKTEERYKTRDEQNSFLLCSNKRFQDSFKSQNIRCGGEIRWRGFDNVLMSVFACVFSSVSKSVCVKIYLALATHSMMASFLPTVTLVFLGGMMIEGAMGSAGPPTSIAHTRTHRRKEKQNLKLFADLRLSLCICLI